MIKITNLLDLWKSKIIPEYISQNMEEKLLKLCKEWLTDDIESFGAYFYVENTTDLDNYKETGMTERIEKAEPEWMEVLKSKSGEFCYVTCYIVSDSYAIVVYCENHIFKDLN